MAMKDTTDLATLIQIAQRASEAASEAKADERRAANNLNKQEVNAKNAWNEVKKALVSLVNSDDFAINSDLGPMVRDFTGEMKK